jgi:hypothetical protein
MLDFKPVTIGDRAAIQAFFDHSTFRNCDYSFSNIFCWKHLYNTTFAIEDDFLYIRFQTSDDIPGYLFPLGKGDIAVAINRIRRDASARHEQVRLNAITQAMADLAEEAFPGKFIYRKNRAWSEYIYNSTDLIGLAGKRFQPKRNHIHRFTRTYDWEYLPISRDIIPDCLKLYRRWCAENGGCSSEQMLVEECRATQTAFKYFEQLGLIGGALRINGEILAYSYGQPLGADTFGVHAEKSLYEIEGGFTMINQQFAEHNCSAYTYINREEDLGLESLRKAKLSYHPAILLDKGCLEEANQ